MAALTVAGCSGSHHTPGRLPPTTVPSGTGSTTTTPSPPTGSTSVPGGSDALGPIYGVTIDDVSNLDSQVAALAALPVRPVARVYFDVRLPASGYLEAVKRISGVATVMGELLDSSDEKSITADALRTRVAAYAAALGPWVGIWEVGNEVNGSWLGDPAQVSAKVIAAWDGVRSSRAATALTLYANTFGPDNCGDGLDEQTPEQFSNQYVPADIRRTLQYVFLSYYPDQCGGVLPSDAAVRAEVERLHAIYPGARIGFGEVGLPEPVTPSDVAHAEQVMDWAYSLDPGLDYYVGGYFWWYATEDALQPSGPLSTALPAAFRVESKALGAPG